jgi:hypothetical protein
MNPLTTLEQQYSAVIKGMKKQFNAHEFILVLAHQHQGLYIQLLHQYVNHAAPFQNAHRDLAQSLSKFPQLVKHIGQVNSTDIFGHSNSASLWEKV